MKKPIHLIMPHWNGGYDVVRAYLSIIERTNYPYKLTIIDDGSDEKDAGLCFLKELAKVAPPHIKIIFNEENIGVVKNLNNGFDIYPDLDCVRLDADIEIQSCQWLNELVKFGKEKDNVGVVAPIALKSDMYTVFSAGQVLVVNQQDRLKYNQFPYEIFNGLHKLRSEFLAPIEVDAVLGCCAYYKREVIDKLGGLDSRYFGWVEDNDFCVGTRSLGFKVFVLPHVSFNHWEHPAKRLDDEREKILQESEKIFIEKWGWSLYDPVPYFDDIKDKYKGTEIMWRYNNEKK